MQARVTKLEAVAEKTGERLAQIDMRLARIETKQDEFIKHYATRDDLYKAINDQTWKIITWTTGLGAALVAITFFIARNVT